MISKKIVPWLLHLGLPKIAQGQRLFLSGMKILLRLLVVGILPAPLSRSIPRFQDFSGES